jgi:hypothetical protein
MYLSTPTCYKQVYSNIRINCRSSFIQTTGRMCPYSIIIATLYETLNIVLGMFQYIFAKLKESLLSVLITLNMTFGYIECKHKVLPSEAGVGNYK